MPAVLAALSVGEDGGGEERPEEQEQNESGRGASSSAPRLPGPSPATSARSSRPKTLSPLE